MEPEEPTPDEAAQPTAEPSTAGVTPLTDQPSPTTPPVTTSWATPAPPDNKRESRPFLVFAWVLALALAAFLALLEYRTSSGGEGYRAGRAVGTFLGPFLLALVLRFIWTRFFMRSSTGPKPVLRSRWIPLGALILMAVNFAGDVGSLVPPAPVDANSAVRISAPFTLREAPPEMTDIAEASFKSLKSIRSYALREVVSEDGSISLLLVADGALRDREGAIEESARGVEEASGLKTTIESINGRKVAIAAGDTLAIASWIEEPLLFSIYAADRPTLDAVLQAVMTAPPT